MVGVFRTFAIVAMVFVADWIILFFPPWMSSACRPNLIYGVFTAIFEKDDRKKQGPKQRRVHHYGEMSRPT